MKLISFVFFILVGGVFAGEDWPGYLGPNRDGSAAAPGLFGDVVALERMWVSDLGSGFSGIIVGDGKLFTMHTAGEMDALSCFDTARGMKLWTFKYGATFPKVGSSEPGPLSTPVLDGGLVYGVGAMGALFCVEADTGKRVWATNIVKDFGAVARDVGIASSPLVAGDFLILNVGDQKDKSIAAFHKKTGDLAWHLGAEAISFQSPALVNLLGRQQLVALSATNMRGIDAATGKLLWAEDSKEWIQTFAIGTNQLLAGHYHGFSLYQLAETAGKMKLTEQWNNPFLTLEYAMPVHHQGYLYGFKGEFITCLDLKTGKKVWSSRKAGRSMAILVNGHLAMMSPDGVFRIVRAWEQGYEERASLLVFQKSGLTAPSYADGVFYVRNYTHLAAVKVK